MLRVNVLTRLPYLHQHPLCRAVVGRGRFVLLVTKVEPQTSAKHNLPSQLTSFIGREQEPSPSASTVWLPSKHKSDDYCLAACDIARRLPRSVRPSH